MRATVPRALFLYLFTAFSLFASLPCAIRHSSSCRVRQCRVVFLKARTPTPQASYHPPASGGPGHPVGGHLPPSTLDRASGLPSKAAIYGLALPRHRRTRHPYCAGGARQLWVWVGSVLLVPTPSMWGPGRPSLAGRGTHFLVGGVHSAGGWKRRFSWDGPPYAGDRDASPTRGEAPVGLASQCFWSV